MTDLATDLLIRISCYVDWCSQIWHISDRGLQVFASDERKELFLQDEAIMLSKVSVTPLAWVRGCVVFFTC